MSRLNYETGVLVINTGVCLLLETVGWYSQCIHKVESLTPAFERRTSLKNVSGKFYKRLLFTGLLLSYVELLMATVRNLLLYYTCGQELFFIIIKVSE